MDAKNIHQVFDWLGTSGQLSESDIAQLPELGYTTVINLALPSSTPALPGEAEYVTREGMNYLHIPVEWESPELPQLIQFFGLLKTFEGHQVWVHCAKNMRVSAFIYLYRRLCLAEDETTASYPMSAVWSPNPIWHTFIQRVLALQNHPDYNWALYKRVS